MRYLILIGTLLTGVVSKSTTTTQCTLNVYNIKFIKKVRDNYLMHNVVLLHNITLISRHRCKISIKTDVRNKNNFYWINCFSILVCLCTLENCVCVFGTTIVYIKFKWDRLACVVYVVTCSSFLNQKIGECRLVASLLPHCIFFFPHPQLSFLCPIIR